MKLNIKWLAISCLSISLSCVANTEAATVLQTATFGTHTYKLFGDDSGSRLLWPDAQAAALVLGGNLVTVNDAAENAFLLETFGASAISATPPEGGLISLWLGLNDAAQEGQFVWADGAPITYTNWVPGEPVGGVADEDFIGMVVGPGFGTPGQWHDIVSDFRFSDVTFGVVEIAPTTVPIPAAAWLFGGGLSLLSLMRRKHKKQLI